MHSSRMRTVRQLQWWPLDVSTKGSALRGGSALCLIGEQTGVKTLPSLTVGNKHDQFKTALTYSTIVANYAYLDYS